jgi:hypothetical protein
MLRTGELVRLFVGDDWAEDHHDVEVMSEQGAVLGKARLPEGAAGMARLHELTGAHLGDDPGAAQVVIGIETDHGPWVAALVAAGYAVYAVNPNKSCRVRHPADLAEGGRRQVSTCAPRALSPEQRPCPAGDRES